jgi:ribose transport system substrate-binding protein
MLGSRAVVRPLLVMGMAATVALAAGCGSSDSSSDASGGTSTGSAPAAAKTYKIVLSNNYMANEWRPQMVNDVKYVAGTKFKGKVALDVKISDVPPAAQIASLQSVIRDKPDAIIMEAASPTALNPTIKQACAQGIKVITFDQTATAPCGKQIPFDVDKQVVDMFNWLATKLGGHGNVVVDEGLAGSPRSAQVIAQYKKLAKNYPDIHVVAHYASNYSDGPEQQAIASVAGQTQVDGVVSNYSCAAVLAGLKKAGKKAVPCTSDSSNRAIKACIDAKVPCFFYGGPAFIGVQALEAAVKWLDGGAAPPAVETFFNKNLVTADGNIKFKSLQPYEVIKEGVSYFPDESPSLFTPVTYADWNITPAAALGK